MPFSTVAGTALLLAVSNLFMTAAWYGHLKYLHDRPWWIAVLVSWGIAFFEYLVQVPANRLGATALNLAQLKIMQEVITLCVFAPFAVVVMGSKLTMNFAYAGICMLGAVYFIFRG
ncbi:MAG: DMT family protein [Rudaea sp.]